MTPRNILKTIDKRLRDVLDSILTEEYALPTYQRKFVWYSITKNRSSKKKNKKLVRDLFDSVYRSMTTGAIIIVSKGEETTKPFNTSKDIKNPLNVRYLVIDGQQRLTVLLYVLEKIFIDDISGNHIKLYISFNPLYEKMKSEGKNVWLFEEGHIFIDGNSDDELLESYNKKMKEHVLLNQCIDLFQLYYTYHLPMKNDNKVEFDNLIKEFISYTDSPDTKFQYYRDICIELINYIDDYTIPTICLSSKMPIEDRLLQFDRLNQNNVSLTRMMSLQSKLGIICPNELVKLKEFRLNKVNKNSFKQNDEEIIRLIMLVEFCLIHDSESCKSVEDAFIDKNNYISNFQNGLKIISNLEYWKEFNNDVLKSIGFENIDILDNFLYITVFGIFIIGKRLNIGRVKLKNVISLLLVNIFINSLKQNDIINKIKPILRIFKELIDNKEKKNSITIENEFLNQLNGFTLISEDTWNLLKQDKFCGGKNSNRFNILNTSRLHIIWKISKIYKHVGLLFDPDNVERAKEYFSSKSGNGVEDHHVYSKEYLDKNGFDYDKHAVNSKFNLLPAVNIDNKTMSGYPPWEYWKIMITKTKLSNDKINKMLNDLDLPKEVFVVQGYSFGTFLEVVKGMRFNSIKEYWKLIGGK